MTGPFNKVCEAKDWDRLEVQKAMRDQLKSVGECEDHKQRKHWEWAIALAALRQYGYLREDKVALGLGAGHEAFMYALANEIKLVIGTDLYGSTEFSDLEADAAILRDPSQFSPFPYQKDRLLVMEMDATDIVFGDCQFDILFSFSSLEHFGPSAKIEQAMKEAHRVLKPGGVYVLSLDYIMEPPFSPVARDMRPDLAGAAFTRDEVVRLLIDSPGFLLKQPVQFDVDRTTITNVYNSISGESSSGDWFPHIYLGFAEYLFTSLSLVLFKV